MSALNKVQLIGNVGKEPEIRTLRNNDRVATFSLATTESWKDKETGERKEKTEWHNVCVFNDGLAGVIEKYVSTGSKLYVEGSIRTRKYEKDGQDRYVTEIVVDRNGKLLMLDGKPDAGGRQQERRGDDSAGQTRAYQPRQAQGPRESFSADLNDEIPF